MATYLDKGTVKFVLLAALFAFLLQARPPQQEVAPFERPVGWFPGASRPSNRSNQETSQAVQLYSTVGVTCGEPEGTVYVAASGRAFVSDLNYLAPGTEKNIGDFSFTDGYSIQNASDQGLYVRERFGPMTYHFMYLENGVYDITFYETEAWYEAPGKRVFAIYINDELTSASNVDLFLRAGGSRIATDISLQHTVTTNQMVISFQPLVDQPKINAIWAEKVGDLPAVPEVTAAALPAPAEAETNPPVNPPVNPPTNPPTDAPTDAPTDSSTNTPAEPPLHYVSSLGVNCGAPSGTEAYFDKDGRKFVSDDQYYVPETGLGVEEYTELTVEGTDDQALYQFQRYGPMEFRFDALENGIYWVTFYETEPSFSGPGERIFNISINGEVIEPSNVDLFTRSGGQNVLANFGMFQTVEDHSMSIAFLHVLNEPIISAIYIQKVQDLAPTSAEAVTPTPELPTPAAELATPEPELPTPEPELPTPEPELPTPAPELPTPAPELPTPAPELPTPAPELPTPAPELPTPAPEVLTPAPELPPPAPETSTAAQTGGKESAVEQSQTVPPAPVFKPVPEETQRKSTVPQWILNGLPISFYSTLACTAVAGPIAELFGYKTIISIGAFARVLIQLVLLFGMPLAAAQVQYGIGAAADVILVAFLFLHVAERHFQLATSAVVAASAIGVVGAAAISQLMQYFMPDVLIRWLPLGSMLLAAFLASLLPQDPVRDELDRTKADRQGAARLPLRGVFGREGLVSEFVGVYRSQALWILSFWWVFASAVNASLLNYAPDLLTEINANAFFNKYAINIVHILSAVGALIAIKLAAPVARSGGLAYLLGSLIIGLAAVGALLVENLGMAYTSLVLTAGIAQMLLCLVFAQSAALVPNGRFALLFGTNATLALLVQGATQLALDHMGWHIGVHFFVLGLASICGALLFGLMWALHKCATGRTQLVNRDDLAGDYNLIGGSRHGSHQGLPIYEIQDESAWKSDDVDENDEGDVEMLGLIEGRPDGGVVVKNEGSLTRL